MKITKYLGALLFFILVGCAHHPNSEPSSVILEMDKLSSFEPYLQKIDDETLVAFDLGGVLMCAKDPLLQEKQRKKFHELLLQKTQKKQEATLQLLGKVIAARQVQPLEKTTSSFVKKIQGLTPYVMALSKGWDGAVGKTPSFLTDVHLRNLQSLGIDFSPAFQNTFPLLKAHLIPVDSRSNIMFQKGVLFTLKTPKGAALETFFKYINWKPKRIVFFDDKRENIESVKRYCSQEGIEFIGIHYVSPMKKQTLFNKKRAIRLINHLQKTGVWMGE